jgi:hypothetical protein
MRRRMSIRSSKNISEELLSSQSDDQLYRGGRRKSIMPVSPRNGKVDIKEKADLKDVKTSSGQPVYRRKIIELEGDGPLGIIFRNNNGYMCIKTIMDCSVASEYFEVEVGMNVIQINNKSCKDICYFKSMEYLGNIWKTESRLTLHFEYENVDDMINNPIFNPVYKFLKSVDCEDYYGEFAELGAKDMEDLKFIEYDDLVKMKMPLLKIRKINDILRLKEETLKSKLMIQFNPELTEKDKQSELENIIRLHSQNFEIEVIESQEDADDESYDEFDDEDV